jgi:hypothetical protein
MYIAHHSMICTLLSIALSGVWAHGMRPYEGISCNNENRDRGFN